MLRTRVYDLRSSRLPTLLGLCQDNIPALCNYINAAQRRLLMCKEATDEGFWGTWAEIAFNVSRTEPYITLPREIARLEAVNVCDFPVYIQNQFYEYLRFGNGRLPKQWPVTRWNCNRQGYTRNNAVTFTDLTNAPQYLTVYQTDTRDVGKRVLLQGLDSNGNTIYSTDVGNQVVGEFVALDTVPVQSVNLFSQINGIQKDQTEGIIRIYQHDPTTGDEILLLTMQPSETTASYRRYYFNGLPCNCCGTDVTAPVQITALAKLDLIPVQTDTDYTLIQNIEAITEECQSIRYSEMDSPTAKGMSAERHLRAIEYLNGELNHFIGKNQPAVGFFPFSAARLERQKIGTLI